jgi:hypothetical protein
MPDTPSLTELWLPILAAGLGGHIASTIAWTALPHHKPEWPSLPADKDPRGWLDERGVKAGQYILPPEGKPGGQGNGGMLTLWSRGPNMGANIGLTLAFFFTVATLVAYVASVALPRGAAAIDIFRLVFTVGLLTHVLGGSLHVVWFRRRYLMDALDGVAYALVTAIAFAALWPGK